MVLLMCSSNDMILFSATFASSEPSLEWTQTWRNFIKDSVKYDTIEDFCIREIPWKLLMFFDSFLGTGMMLAFCHCAGASSDDLRQW